MSKQSDAKLKQGWSKTTIKICVNCKHFSCEPELIRHAYASYTKDRNMRCNLGVFKTGKSSTCNDWCANPPNDEASNVPPTTQK